MPETRFTTETTLLALLCILAHGTCVLSVEEKVLACLLVCLLAVKQSVGSLEFGVVFLTFPW